MRKKGRITSWNDDKGFGFVSPLTGGERTFVHIKAFANRSRRPVEGDIVTYTVSADAQGRRCAQAATIAGVPAVTRPGQPTAGRMSEVIAVVFLTVIGGAAAVAAIPLPILLVYLGVSLVTFVAYALDKRAAGKGEWRTSESTLHLLALGGGWPGALIAQGRLRHKTRKQPFRAVFLATVVLNCAAFGWLSTAQGTATWRALLSAVA